jgi:hypothetical protein
VIVLFVGDEIPIVVPDTDVTVVPLLNLFVAGPDV